MIEDKKIVPKGSETSQLSTIQDILRTSFPAYRQSHKLPLFVLKAIGYLIACRTASLGGHVLRCPVGHVEKVWYNSCKHRFCPQCFWISMEKWLLKQQSRLLNCDHYHVVFTIPDELRNLWRLNSNHLSDLLFKAATETLQELLADPKYLGARVGIIASLHTWSQTLILHPHIHCLVTGGGLKKQHEWTMLRCPFLLPKRVAMKKFRGKLLTFIIRDLNRGLLVYPPDMHQLQWRRLVRKVVRKKWNVKIMERYAYGKGVLTYLSRYVRGGPISNKRLVKVSSDTVTFRYRPSGQEQTEKSTGLMTLSHEEFISRLLTHVPPPRSRTVRYYGLYFPNQRTTLDYCREQCDQSPVEDPETLDWQNYCAQRGGDHPERCPVCHTLLIITDLFHAGCSPPEPVLKLLKKAS